MFQWLFFTVVFSIPAFLITNNIKHRFPQLNLGVFNYLYWYHSVLALAYFIYTIFYRSDSQYYYSKVKIFYRGENWFDFYGTSTTFIEWVGFPFVNYFGFSYEAMMALFSFFGFIGFVYFYLFFKERIRFEHKIFGFNFLTLIFLLPNLHFWSSSFGKGSLIFMGLGLFFYAMNQPMKRWLGLIIGGLIIYHVRPHIMTVLLVSMAISFAFSTKGVSLLVKSLVILGAGASFFYIYTDVLLMVGLEQETLLTEGLDMSHRAFELSKSGSGVDISNYSIPLLLFTFIYRPLFFDAPGMLGYIVSFENLFYLLVTIKLINLKGLTFLVKADYSVKTAFISFITISLALAQVSGNLGMAMRQKSQVMILFMFVIIIFLDDQKLQQYKVWRRRKKRKEIVT